MPATTIPMPARMTVPAISVVKLVFNGPAPMVAIADITLFLPLNVARIVIHTTVQLPTFVTPPVPLQELTAVRPPLIRRIYKGAKNLNEYK